MRRRVGESIESFRERDAAYKRKKYAQAKAEGKRPRELIAAELRRRAAGSEPMNYISGVCLVCGAGVLALQLCYRHYRAQKRVEGVPWANEGNKANRARARRFGVYYEPVNRVQVFERDGYMCGICQEPVNIADASLDHIIPISKGGAHSYSNTQCAHLICNIRKGAKVEV